jgi:hypothetical protein
MTTAAVRYQAEREALLQHISQHLAADQRVVAAWLFGSLGRGQADALSDIDLWVVVADEAIAELVADRRPFTAQPGKPVLILEAPQNAPVGGAYLMTAYEAPTGPHIVDWYWQPRSAAFIPPQAQVLFDRVGLTTRSEALLFTGGDPDPVFEAQPLHVISFFWMMWLIAAKQMARAPQSETVPLLPYVLGPFCKTQRYLGLTASAECDADDLPSLPSPADKLRRLQRLADEMVEMMKSVAARGQAVPDAMVPSANRYLKLIGDMAKTYQT